MELMGILIKKIINNMTRESRGSGFHGSFLVVKISQ